MIQKRAVWIFDNHFKELTLLSVLSFRLHSDWPVVLVYCGSSLNDIKVIFDRQIDNIAWVQYNPDVAHFPIHIQGTVTNRLARIFICKRYCQELVLLVDSDILFTDQLKDGIKLIQKQITTVQEQSSCILGVKEYDKAIDAYLIYHKRNRRGDVIKLSASLRDKALTFVFGEDYNRLLETPQFNNGLLFFYNCEKLIDQWNEYYLKLLLNEELNPADDQVPLAAAIKKSQTKTIELNSSWNSLGRLTGDYIAIHAWAGGWKNEIKDVLAGAEELTLYAKICATLIHKCKKSWLDELERRLHRLPTYFQRIPGYFDFGGIYDDIVKKVVSGHFVEVGTYRGRSACYMGELIKASKKEILFDTIDHYGRKDTVIKQVAMDLEKSRVLKYVNLIHAHSRSAVELYKDNSLDFVFIDIEQTSHEFTYELENWYSKLKEGGVLAGYDYSIHDTINYGYLCYTQEFAKNYKIPLRTYKQRFILTKNTKYCYDTI